MRTSSQITKDQCQKAVIQISSLNISHLVPLGVVFLFSFICCFTQLPLENAPTSPDSRLRESMPSTLDDANIVSLDRWVSVFELHGAFSAMFALQVQSNTAFFGYVTILYISDLIGNRQCSVSGTSSTLRHSASTLKTTIHMTSSIHFRPLSPRRLIL